MITLVGHVDCTHAAATSDLCTNASKARIADVIWHEDDRQGIALSPRQQLLLDPWISFPEAPHLVPFEVQPTQGLRLDEEQVMYALLETQLSPVEPRSNNVLMVCRNGGRVRFLGPRLRNTVLDTDKYSKTKTESVKPGFDFVDFLRMWLS